MSLELKIAGVGIAGCLLIAGASFGVNHYKTKWQGEIHAQYAESTRQALIKRNAEIERERLAQEEINRKVVADYENKLKTLSDRLASAKRDGLRMPKTVCSGIAATAEATSTKGTDGDETIRLPERIESGLFGLAEKCEQVQIERNSLQKWIIYHGFYPAYQTSTPNK
jgi:hypothetical protein